MENIPVSSDEIHISVRAISMREDTLILSNRECYLRDQLLMKAISIEI